MGLWDSTGFRHPVSQSHMRSPIRSTAIVLASVAALACGSSTEPRNSIHELEFTPALQVLLNGATAMVTVAASGADGVAIAAGSADLATIKWKSDDSTIVSVVGSGTGATLSAHKYGTTTIRATAPGGVLGTLSVSVNNGITGVTLTAASGTIPVGGKTALNATVQGDNPNHAVTYSTSNQQVATIDASGVVSGLATGSVTITATSTADPTYQGTVSILVRAAALPRANITAATQTASPAGCNTAPGFPVTLSSVCGTFSITANLLASDFSSTLIEAMVGTTVCGSLAINTAAATTITLSCNTAGVAPGPTTLTLRATYRTETNPTVNVTTTAASLPITIAP
jgi:hypothetical protein